VRNAGDEPKFGPSLPPHCGFRDDPRSLGTSHNKKSLDSRKHHLPLVDAGDACKTVLVRSSVEFRTTEVIARMILLVEKGDEDMASKDNGWAKPEAMAIPEGGYFKYEQGNHGPIFPRTPACHGFTIIAKVKPGREAAMRSYAATIEKAMHADPFFLAPLKL